MGTVNLRFYTIIYFIGISGKVYRTWLKKRLLSDWILFIALKMARILHNVVFNVSLQCQVSVSVCMPVSTIFLAY